MKDAYLLRHAEVPGLQDRARELFQLVDHL